MTFIANQNALLMFFVASRALDRFVMSVDIATVSEPSTMVEIVKRRLTFDRDPAAFCDECREDTEALRERIGNAREILPEVVASDSIIHSIAVASIKFGRERHRADLAMIRSAKANAALDGRKEVVKQDIVDTAPLVMQHRIKSGPFEEARFDREALIRCL